ncbi:MAG: hypothetical protein AVDCRST_MAG11-2483 [uncultured Gemmatimonadaceae bacterium]|uniref:Uncharacterized protein n=1 Tax=uncultured Gemmatimonadaceae bacterium TaxID=246130 RepID=A0A6J4LKB8_9BACT|nr:MAG: hypothetical protein AVDCRST_MAG11-2483 [uncultured Gemmatimonadaceae bacterium]
MRGEHREPGRAALVVARPHGDVAPDAAQPRGDVHHDAHVADARGAPRRRKDQVVLRGTGERGDADGVVSGDGRHLVRPRQVKCGGASTEAGRTAGSIGVVDDDGAVGGTAIARMHRGWARVPHRCHPEPQAKVPHVPSVR